MKDRALPYPSQGYTIQWDPIPCILAIHRLSGEIGMDLKTDSQA